MGNIGQLRHARLHPIREFILRDARGNLRVADFRELHLVQDREIVEHPAARRGVETGRIGKEEHEICSGAELDALMFRGQEAAAPQAIVERLAVRIARAVGKQRDKRRQVAVLTAQSVAEP
jgi:hypothetical protein